MLSQDSITPFAGWSVVTGLVLVLLVVLKPILVSFIRLFTVDLPLAISNMYHDYLGAAFDIGQQLLCLGDENKWLHNIQDVLQQDIYDGRHHSSREWREWMLGVQAWRLSVAEIKFEHHQKTGSCLLTKWRLLKEVKNLRRRAAYLAYQAPQFSTKADVARMKARSQEKNSLHAAGSGNLVQTARLRPDLHGMDSYIIQVSEFLEPRTTPSSSLMGVWGMHGIGKTTLLSLLRTCYTNPYPFHYFIFATAGAGLTVDKLLAYLAWNIGLGWMPSSDRVKIVSSFLRGVPFLLLLDDVRESFDLAAAGLPTPLGPRQKVIFTTRNQAICADMGCDASNTIQMRCLAEDVAWDLFRYHVRGDIFDRPDIERRAKKMVAECQGVPGALVELCQSQKTWMYGGSSPMHSR